MKIAFERNVAGKGTGVRLYRNNRTAVTITHVTKEKKKVQVAWIFFVLTTNIAKVHALF